MVVRLQFVEKRQVKFIQRDLLLKWGDSLRLLAENAEIKPKNAAIRNPFLLASVFHKRSLPMPDQSASFGLGTLGVWGGELGPHPMNAAQAPIVQSAAFAYPDVASWRAVALGKAEGDIYSRNSNPTVRLFEEKMRLFEGGEAATAFASGMAAISNTLQALLRPGDRVVSIKDSYGATSRIFLEILPSLGIEVVLIDTHDQDALHSAIRKGCRMVYVETPTNPLLKIVDLIALGETTTAAGAVLVVDNTFATPINQSPLKFGADLVLHSATKFLGGHDDVLGGILIGRTDLVVQVHRYREITGASLSPLSAYLLLRGLKTLQLRVERANSTALQIAEFLSSDPRVERVFYPGLASHPGHGAARKQMVGFGGVLSFTMNGGEATAERLIDALQLVSRAASFGAVNTLVGLPSTTSHVEVSSEVRARLGIPEALVRYSCGVEDPGDLLGDLRQALAAAHE